MNPFDSKNIGAFLFGAYAATAVLSVYTLLSSLGTAIVTVAPFAAGLGLFLGLLLIFVSALTMVSKVRSGNGNPLAIADVYKTLAVLTVIGYVITACVATFQPGANPAQFWTNSAVLTLTWFGIFTIAKYFPDFYREGGK